MRRPALVLLALSTLAVSLARAAQPVAFVKTIEPVVALTFDDGPRPGGTQPLLDFFAREQIRVTFFEIGDRVATYPDLARAIVAAGHEIGNHSKSHVNLTKLADPAAVRAEIVETQSIIERATGVAPRVFRAPFIAHDPGVLAILDELGLPSIASRVPTRDWDLSVTREQIVERASAAGPGDIVLMHSWRVETHEALPEIIARLRAKGLRFVTVSELLALRATAP